MGSELLGLLKMDMYNRIGRDCPFTGCLWSTLQLSLEQESNVRVESGGERKMTDWEGGIVARASLQRDGLKFAVLPAVFWWTEDARRGNPERTGALGRAAFCGGPMFRPTVG